LVSILQHFFTALSNTVWYSNSHERTNLFMYSASRWSIYTPARCILDQDFIEHLYIVVPPSPNHRGSWQWLLQLCDRIVPALAKPTLAGSISRTVDQKVFG